MDEKDIALNAIRKKLVGKKLTYNDVYAVMDEIAHNKLGDVLTTYFAASGYATGFSNQEIYFLTRAMVETGEKLKFKGIIADKHSIGGLPGTRTTLIVVPIVAAAGFTIPKSSSRAITTPSGTADMMESLAAVEFSKEEIYAIVKKTNGCIVWGGSFHIAPADDIMIKVEEPLSFESYDKILVSIMAKKVAFGSTHVIIDLPYGTEVKVHRLKDAETMKKKFEYLANRFGIKIHVFINHMYQPAGSGIGPILEARDGLRVLQQKDNRPLDLEKKSLLLAGNLLELCLKDAKTSLKEEVKKKYTTAHAWAEYILKSGIAWQKMQEIIRAQNGNPHKDSESLQPGKYSWQAKSINNKPISRIFVKNLTVIAKILGSPMEKKSGIYLHKKIGDSITYGEILYTLYSENMYNLSEAKHSIRNFPILEQ